jgi:DNA-directed RNA polymerase subunit beta
MWARCLNVCLGWAAENLNARFKVIPFDEMYGQEASRNSTHGKLQEARDHTGKDWVFNPEDPGKIQAYDGRTG